MDDGVHEVGGVALDGLGNEESHGRSIEGGSMEGPQSKPKRDPRQRSEPLVTRQGGSPREEEGLGNERRPRDARGAFVYSTRERDARVPE